MTQPPSDAALRAAQEIKVKYLDITPNDELLNDIAAIIDREHLPVSEQGRDEDECQRRMDAVVDAAVEWHQSGREGDNTWFDKGEALDKAIDSLLELRTTPPTTDTVLCEACCQPLGGEPSIAVHERCTPKPTDTVLVSREWLPIETADLESLTLLYTPASKLWEDPADKPIDVRVAKPRDWTWATHWMPCPNCDGCPDQQSDGGIKVSDLMEAQRAFERSPCNDWEAFLDGYMAAARAHAPVDEKE